VIGILLFSILFLSFKSNNDKKDSSNNNIYKLTKNMIKEDVDDLLGEPTEDVGSGLSVYIYRIDTYTVLVSYDSDNKLISATLQNNDETEEQLIK
jgi:hypothetical protein